MQTDRATLLAALISPNNPLNWRSFNSTGIPGKSRTEISRGEDLFPEQVHEDEEERRRRRREKEGLICSALTVKIKVPRTKSNLTHDVDFIV